MSEVFMVWPKDTASLPEEFIEFLLGKTRDDSCGQAKISISMES